MWRLIIFLIFLIASVWFGLEVVRHPGYLLVVYQPWMVQMPLWFALLSALIIFALFYLLITSVDRLYFLWFKLKSWLRLRRAKQAYSKTQQGLALLIEGHFKKAERLLLAGADQTAEPLVNYLAAAKAAQEQSAYDRRDSYIQKAYRIAPHANLAIGITQAELELAHHQLEHAAATLEHLRQLAPRHPQVLRLSEKVYVNLAEWKKLLALVPNLRKAKVITAEQAEIFEKNLYCEEFAAASYQDLTMIQQMWNDLPRHMRKNPEVVLAYVQQLQRFPDSAKEKEDIIRQTLKKNWQAQLVNLYGDLPFTQLNKQLVIAGGWLKQYGERPELLLLLGKLCVRIQLWGKAKDYFERCLAQGPNAEASLEYGKLLEQLDETEAAIEKYRDGLASASKNCK